MIARQDHGKGSSFGPEKRKEKIGTIARRALSLPYQCRFMARLVHFQQVRQVLEFGTSFGISAGYLEAGYKEAKITTVEGDPEIAKVAMQIFSTLHCTQIHLIVSTFSQYLHATLHDSTPIDLLFLDGHHEANALLEYFNKLKYRFTTNTIVIVDDIYWSKDMHEGWKQLYSMEEVTQSVDCFSFGLLFFRKEFIARENHKIRFPLNSFLG